MCIGDEVLALVAPSSVKLLKLGNRASPGLWLAQAVKTIRIIKLSCTSACAKCPPFTCRRPMVHAPLAHGRILILGLRMYVGFRNLLPVQESDQSPSCPRLEFYLLRAMRKSSFSAVYHDTSTRPASAHEIACVSRIRSLRTLRRQANDRQNLFLHRISTRMSTNANAF